MKESRETLANPSNGVHHVVSESKLSWRCSSGLGLSRCITDNRLRPILTVGRKSWQRGLRSMRLRSDTVHSSAWSTSLHPPRRYRISLHFIRRRLLFGMGMNDGSTGGNWWRRHQSGEHRYLSIFGKGDLCLTQDPP